MANTFPINLGVDFGTRYTKVCARSDEVGVAICDFCGTGTDGALLGSALEQNPDGTLRAPDPGSTPTEAQSIRHLKMALAERAPLETGAALEGVIDRSERTVAALAAFYLAVVIARAKAWVTEHWRPHIGSREIHWSANVGLPVEICDSPIAPKFQEALAVAWEWAERGFEGKTIDEIIECYTQAEARSDPSMSPCQIYPEIAAAVLSFATSRSAAPGIYIYFDIGGGTVDGVAFNLLRESGEVSINFYSGRVEALGVDVIVDQAAEMLSQRTSDPVDRRLIKKALLYADSEQSGAAFQSYLKPIRQLVGQVIMEAKGKHGHDWRSGSFQDFPEARTVRQFIDDSRLKPLKIFIGGGGIRSPYYQHAIGSTYRAFRHRSAGIPPYSLIEVPAPADLDLGSISDEDYHRFLVAYGLSVPFGEGPDFRLPSAFERIASPKVTEPEYGLNYLDSKDMFD